MRSPRGLACPDSESEDESLHEPSEVLGATPTSDAEDGLSTSRTSSAQVSDVDAELSPEAPRPTPPSMSRTEEERSCDGIPTDAIANPRVHVYCDVGGLELEFEIDVNKVRSETDSCTYGDVMDHLATLAPEVPLSVWTIYHHRRQPTDNLVASSREMWVRSSGRRMRSPERPQDPITAVDGDILVALDSDGERNIWTQNHTPPVRVASRKSRNRPSDASDGAAQNLAGKDERSYQGIVSPFHPGGLACATRRCQRSTAPGSEFCCLSCSKTNSKRHGYKCVCLDKHRALFRSGPESPTSQRLALEPTSIPRSIVTVGGGSPMAKSRQVKGKQPRRESAPRLQTPSALRTSSTQRTQTAAVERYSSEEKRVIAGDASEVGVEIGVTLPTRKRCRKKTR